MVWAPSDYAPWPEEGCSLETALERTADRCVWRRWVRYVRQQGRKRQKATGKAPATKPSSDPLRQTLQQSFLQMLGAGALVAYARRRASQDDGKWIERSIWQKSPQLDWEHSVIKGDGRALMELIDVRVFPVLLAPDCVEIVSGRALKEVMREFVLQDPEVAALAAAAIRLAPDFKKVFIQGNAYVQGWREWPLGSGRTIGGAVHPDPKKRLPFEARNADPIEAVVAAEALTHRYRALTELLRGGVLEARGVSVAQGGTEVLLRSIWWHREFYLDVDGDIFQFNHDEGASLLRRWIAVELRAPPAAARQLEANRDGLMPSVRPRHDALREPEPRRRSTKRLAVEKALTKHQIDLSDPNIGPKEIAATIASDLATQPTSESEWNALAKMIARIRKEASQR